MAYPAYHIFSQAFASGNREIKMNIVKSSTRLSQMFFTFSNGNMNNDATAGKYDKKRRNCSFHPMAVTIDNLEGVIDSDRQISAHIQIANKKFPEQEISSISEFMYFLCRAVNVMSPYYDGFEIDICRYANDKLLVVYILISSLIRISQVPTPKWALSFNLQFVETNKTLR